MEQLYIVGRMKVKRSEMSKKLYVFYNQNFADLEKMCDVEASAILDFLIQEGMKPPIISIEKNPTELKRSPQATHVFAWEPEEVESPETSVEGGETETLVEVSSMWRPN